MNDTGGDASDEAVEPCTIDADISSIQPDAAADSAAAECLTCFKSACPSLIQQCNPSCACKEAYIAFESCVEQGSSLLTCGQIFSAASGLPVSDFTCSVACSNSCGVTLPSDGGGDADGGPHDSGGQ